MGPPMHSPLSSSEDDLNLSQNDDNIADANEDEYGLQSSQGQPSRHHNTRRHKGVYKDRKRRHKRKGHSSSQSDHSSRRRKHKSHHCDNEYDFEPKPKIMSSKPLVQYDDVSENDDIMSNEVSPPLIDPRLYLLVLLFQGEVEEGEVEEEEVEVGSNKNKKKDLHESPESSLDPENSRQSSRSSGTVWWPIALLNRSLKTFFLIVFIFQLVRRKENENEECEDETASKRKKRRSRRSHRDEYKDGEDDYIRDHRKQKKKKRKHSSRRRDEKSEKSLDNYVDNELEEVIDECKRFSFHCLLL